MTRLLLTEDEEALAHSLRVGLEDEGYLVDHARDGAEALWFLESDHHDLVLLDLRLPKVDGFTVCRTLRERGRSVPVLMLTALGETEDVVRGLDLGADDYLVKPFPFEELLARLRALLRRGSVRAETRLSIGDLELDPLSRQLVGGERRIDVSALEFRLLEHLVRHRGRLQTRDRLTAALWQDELGPDSNVLEVLVSRLRRKLESAGHANLIHTRRGEGYWIDETGR